MTSVRRFLDEQEELLKGRLSALRSEIIPLEQELLEVRLAKAALKRDSNPDNQPRFALASPAAFQIEEASSGTSADTVALSASDAFRSPYYRLTIKQLVQKALSEHFPNGATANQMLDLFANVWGRGEIMRTSLSPQLSRLKDDNFIFRTGHVWRLRQIREPEKAATDQ